VIISKRVVECLLQTSYTWIFSKFLALLSQVIAKHRDGGCQYNRILLSETMSMTNQLSNKPDSSLASKWEIISKSHLSEDIPHVNLFLHFSNLNIWFLFISLLPDLYLYQS